MVTYKLCCRSDTGEEVNLYYNPHTSELVDQQGASVIADAAADVVFDDAVRISPTAPGKKSSTPETLKIQLGLRCNYSCSYCSQSGEIESATVTKTADADEFIQGLDTWLTGIPKRIEFWGGEPFLYFAKLRKLVPALDERFPDTEFVIITNGSLIDNEIIDFIERYDITIAVSHDGPGQALRGPDPFEDPERASWLRELWRRRGPGNRMSFNVVFSGANSDVGKTQEWFVEKVGDSEVALSVEGVVSTYDTRTAQGSGRFTKNEYETLRQSMVDAFVDGKALRFGTIVEKAEDFVDSLHRRRPSTALGQKCGMDREDQLAVDLSGKVMTCQNTGANGKHGIGSVSDLQTVRLNTAWHWSNRECCNHCPVLQLCKGACMYLDGDLFAQSCENEYRFNEALLAGIVKHITRLNLERIEGDIRRPRSTKKIPIKLVSQTV